MVNIQAQISQVTDNSIQYLAILTIGRSLIVKSIYSKKKKCAITSAQVKADVIVTHEFSHARSHEEIPGKEQKRWNVSRFPDKFLQLSEVMSQITSSLSISPCDIVTGVYYIYSSLYSNLQCYIHSYSCYIVCSSSLYI